MVVDIIMDFINKKTDFDFKCIDVTDMLDDDLIFIAKDSKICLLDNDIITYKDVATMIDRVFCQFGSINSQRCFIATLKDNSLFDDYVSIRHLYKVVTDAKFKASLLANHLIYWLTSHKFCGVCSGVHDLLLSNELLQKCRKCGHVNYPIIAPCVIGAIYSEDKILLARSHRFANNLYSCIAGFISPGENLEQAFAREVSEEVGISIKNIKYMGSQPWPFPHSLMMGFVAEYDGGSIVVDYNELEDANWFSVDDMKNISLPGELSIARFLIDYVINNIFIKNLAK